MIETSNHRDLIPHLFRTEFGKIAAVLCRFLGAARIDLAEEIASETFVTALESWPYKGVPPNPTAWLYVVAKNKARNYLKRELVHASAVDGLEVGPGVDFEEPDFSDANIADSRLRMLFAISRRSIPPEAQIGLGLRILCGFGIDEIANAFLASKDTIEKRLQRAKKRLREENAVFDFPPAEQLPERLDSVLTTLYLLFSEGYYSESNDAILRRDLCYEAMRLTESLLAEPQTARPEVDALLALMCFHASRFPARTGAVLYDEQDAALWDQTLIYKGGYHLHRASRGNVVSKYHLEASIAYWHTVRDDSTEKWCAILFLFDKLTASHCSPIAMLNRAFAYAKVYGKPDALPVALEIGLESNRYYHALLGWLYEDSRVDSSLLHYGLAMSMSRSTDEKERLRERIAALKS